MEYLTARAKQNINNEKIKNLVFYINQNRHGVIAEALKKINQELIKFLSFLDTIDPIKEYQDGYIVSIELYQTATGIATHSTACKHLNYLFSTGIIDKLDSGIVSDVNVDNTLNVVLIPEITAERKEYIRYCCKALLEYKITRGNISYALMHNRGHTEQADSIFFRNSPKILYKKEQRYEAISCMIDCIISEQGYCTVQDIINRMDALAENEIRDVLRIYKKDIQERYTRQIQLRKTKKSRS